MVGVPSSLSSLSLRVRARDDCKKKIGSECHSQPMDFLLCRKADDAGATGGRTPVSRSSSRPLRRRHSARPPSSPRGVCVHAVGRPRLPDRSSLGRMTRISNEPPSSRCLSLSPNLLYTRMTLPPRPRRKNGSRSCPFYCSSSCGFDTFASHYPDARSDGEQRAVKSRPARSPAFAAVEVLSGESADSR